MTVVRISALFTAVLGLSAPAWAEGQNGWEPVSDDDGIQVWQRPVAGTSLVEFRGTGVVQASAKQILAVLANDERKTEWMHACVENKQVQAITPKRLVVYNRTGSPYPFISDRDVVVETDVQFWPEQKRIRIDAWNIEHKMVPVRDGAVRMPRLILSWILTAKGDNETEVTYQVQADPGGKLPKWLVKLASKKIPYHSIKNLREQVKKDYSRELARVSSVFDFKAIGL